MTRNLVAGALATLIIAFYAAAYAGPCDDGGILFTVKKKGNNGKDDVTAFRNVDGNCNTITDKNCRSAGATICSEGDKASFGQDTSKGSINISTLRNGDQEDEPDKLGAAEDAVQAPPGCCIWTQKGTTYYCWKWAPC